MTTQLQLVETDPTDMTNPWDDLDEATRQRGLRGVARARAALQEANRRAAIRDAAARAAREADAARRSQHRHGDPAPVIHLSRSQGTSESPTHPDGHAAA